LGRNCDRPFSHGGCGKHRRFHNNRGSFRNCDRRWRGNNSHSLLRHHRRYSLNRFTDNFFSRCWSNSQRVGYDAAGFRIRHKRRAGIPDAVTTLLLTLTFLPFLTRFARALTTIRTATTTATTTTAAAFFTALLLGTLCYRCCIGQIGLIQFCGFRSSRCALLLARLLRTILSGAAVTTATLPVLTIALAAFALTTRTAFATATAFTAFASFTTLTATAAA